MSGDLSEGGSSDSNAATAFDWIRFAEDFVSHTAVQVYTEENTYYP